MSGAKKLEIASKSLRIRASYISRNRRSFSNRCIMAAALPGAVWRKPPETKRAAHRRPFAMQRERSVAALVDQRTLLDPRHHVPELGPNLFGLMLGELGAGRL